MLNKEVPNRFELALEVTENTNAMLAYWDADLICRFANSAYLQWFGVLPHDMIDKMHIKQLLKGLYEKNLPFIKEALNGKVQVFERDILTPSGEWRNTIATYTPDIEKGKVKGFYAHVADITQLKKKVSSGETADQSSSNTDLYGTQLMLHDVENTLKSYIFLGFPGISTLAKLHLASESKLKRDFKAKFHVTAFEYFRQLQMEVAEKYIVEKGLSKKQMAAMLKFSNPSNFLVCYQKYLNEKASKRLVDDIVRANNEQYKIFISQLPVAVAMFDINLKLVTSSIKWVTDYQLPEKNLADTSFYDMLPGGLPKWEPIIKKCFEGETSSGEELFTQKDGVRLLLRWNIQRWLNARNETGGFMIFTEDLL